MTGHPSYKDIVQNIILENTMSTSISYRHLLDTFFGQADGKQIIHHQIESYNNFIDHDVPEIIHMINPIIVKGSPETPLGGPRSALATATGMSNSAANAMLGVEVTVPVAQEAANGNIIPAARPSASGQVAPIQHEYEIELVFEKVSIRKPTIFENNGAVQPMLPNDARLRNLTYAAPLNVDVRITTTFIDHSRGGIREQRQRLFPNVHLGKIPVMIGSKYCLLKDQENIHPNKLGECAYDLGGYFIIQGGERAIISQERMSENRPFVFRNGRNTTKEVETVEIKAIGPDNDQVPKSNGVKIVYHPKNPQIMLLRATVPRIKTEIPLFILFRALGVLADADICELILGPNGDPAFESVLGESIQEAGDIHTQEDAFQWLSQFIGNWSVKNQKPLIVQDILQEELFPQVGYHTNDKDYEKACFLAHMTRKVLWSWQNRIPADDRDSYPNKRVDIPGFLLADLFRKTFTTRMIKDIRSALSKEIHGGSWRASQNFEEIVNINNINKIIKATIIDVNLRSSMATGNFGSMKIGAPAKIGVSQVLNRLNYVSSISHMRRISTPIEKTGKLIAPRKLHNSQFGFICPCETPEGGSVGVVKNMSSTTFVSIYSNLNIVKDYLAKQGHMISLRNASIELKHSGVRIFLNGAWIGVFETHTAKAAIDDLRNAKRAGIIHNHTGIVWKIPMKELWITTEAGRLLRPLLYAPALREVSADPALVEEVNNINDWNKLLLWETPSGKNLIEYVDSGESDGIYIGMSIEKTLEDKQTTHSEIHPSILLGSLASNIPFPDHNQSPRNAYQASMGKQAMGMYALNFRERFDAISHILCYAEKPLVSPFMSKFYGAQELPTGQNVVVAIMPYNGYNQEDSNMINRAALERGRMRSIFYRTYKDEERKNQSSGEEERFCRPDPVFTKQMKNANYDKLGADGFIAENEYVRPDDILIGKVVPLRVPTGQVLPAGSKKFRDVSRTPKNNEAGYVDRVYKSRNGEGYSFAKIRMRQDRVPEIGDKFSCYTPDHEVLTTDGWVPIDKVTMEHSIATLQDGQKLQYCRPEEVMSYDFNGKLYSLKTNHVDLKVTPNHRMYVGDRDGKKFTFKTAEEIYGKRLKYKKNVEGMILPVENIPTELLYDNNTPVSFIIKGVGKDSRTVDDIHININDWLLLFGIWIAEGCVSSNSVRIATHKERVRNALDDIASRTNIAFGRYKEEKDDETLNSYRIHKKQIVSYFEPLSVGAVNKSLPKWVWHLTRDQCRMLIDGMMLGDGHTMENGTRRYDTSSKALADDFQRLCLHAGYSTNVSIKYEAGKESVCKAEGREGEVIKSTTTAYRLTIIESQNEPLVNKNIKAATGEGRQDAWEDYNGKVYCCKVPGPGAIYVRRNGIPVWCGNSRHGQKGTVGMILNPEDMPQTAGGIIPDIIINPNCIPSRMTIAQLMETILGKLGCQMGALGDGSPFNKTTIEGIADILRDEYGLEPYGNEIMYNGFTGRMMETSIFIGPCYYQRLRHCSQDKIHSRASGPLVMLTRQPAEGRAREGGLRFGKEIAKVRCKNRASPLWRGNTIKFRGNLP